MGNVLTDFLARRALYAAAAAAIYGERWRMPLATALGVNHRTVRGWFEEEPRSCPAGELAERLDGHLRRALELRKDTCEYLLSRWRDQ